MAATMDATHGMDPAQLIEWEALKYQVGLNEVMDRGDSEVQQFYRGASVFVTGGSGFLGKQLIEKLIRSCQLKKIYVLLRPKKGKTIQERLDYVLIDPLYDLLRKRQPNFIEKIMPIEGDVADIRLGLSEKDWTLLTQEVDTVFHLAATVRFDETLRNAALINVRGTKECLALARECPNLKNFVYVSTAFAHTTKERVRTTVMEQFYPCPVPPEIIIGMAESMDEERLQNVSDEIMMGWPNTYTFTKALAEEVVRSTAADLPVCVVRPPIVVPSFYEPSPGWMDLTALQGPTGILTGIILGILHVFLVNKHSKLPMTPVDYVNNATIAAAWDAAVRRKNGEKDIQVYTVSNKDHFMTWDFIGSLMRTEGVKAASPKALWYCYMIEVKSKIAYNFLSFFLHYIPAYFMDLVGAITGNMPKDITSFLKGYLNFTRAGVGRDHISSNEALHIIVIELHRYVAVFRKIDKFALVYNYFLSNEWYFQDDNVQSMINRMTEADKVIFNCDIKNINFTDYVKIWGVGIRKYVLKDELKDSELGYKRQLKLKVANYFLISFYVFVVFSLLFKCFTCICYLF